MNTRKTGEMYREYFARLVASEPFDLARAALLIAAEDTANADIERTLAQL
ncbi:MAG: hypothetical protein H7Z43_02400, partial [Clostridia bacterium]|nr:hypothetical protein [Deltaproteobacteria bacterium]